MKTLLLLISTVSLALSSPIPDFPFLFVAGNASEEVPTADAAITFSIKNENQQSDLGEKALQEANRSLRLLLRANGVSDKDIRVSDVRKQRVSKDPFDAAKKQVYFEFSQDFTIEIKDLTLYPKLAELLIGSEKVSGFDSSFSGGDLANVKKRLRIAAIKDARANAQILADASEVRVAGVQSISEFDFSRIGGLIGEGSYESPNLPPGRNEVYKVPPTIRESFSVNMLFRLAGKETRTEPTGTGQPATQPADKVKPAEQD